MSYTILTAFSVRRTGENSFVFTASGGCNNVRPFRSERIPFQEDTDHLMIMHDLLGGMLDPSRLRTKTGERVIEAISQVRKAHQKDYKEYVEAFLDKYPGVPLTQLSPYGLYEMGRLYYAQKHGKLEEHLTSAADITHTSEKYRELKMAEGRVLRDNHKRFVSDFRKYGKIFYDIICPIK